MLNLILTTDVYRFMLVFTRLGAALMVMPGIGSGLVDTRLRLLLGLSMAFVLLPVIGPHLPALPDHPAQLAALLVGEATVGIFMGMISQVLLSTMSVAGSFISYQTGLTNAFSFDAVAQEQSQMLTGMLSTMAMVAVFVTDMHHLMLRALVDSYGLFPPGVMPPLGDIAMTFSRMLTGAFGMGLRLSAPVLVFGLVFYTGLGLLSRLVPQMQVFFVAMPVQVLVGLWMLMVALPVILLLFLRYYESGYGPYLAPG